MRGIQVAVVGQGLDVADRGIALERVDVRRATPSAVAGSTMRQPFGERRPQIAGDRHVDADVLVELGAIDVDVDLPRVERVGLEVAGHAIVEPHAEREQQIGLLDRGVHPRLAVHPHHAEVQADATPARRRCPSSVTAIGICARSASARISRSAPDSITPWPARISGRSARVDQRERLAVVAVARAARRRALRIRCGSAASQSNSQVPAARPW